MKEMLTGLIATTSFVAGLFFLRFWKNTKDRFFLFFSIAFLTEAVNRVVLGLTQSDPEKVPFFFLIRLFAYGLILFAVVEKNCPRRPK